MSKYIKFIGIIIISCLLTSTESKTQQLQRHEAIAAYIYNFAKNVIWQNEDAITEFNFVVIGEDRNVLEELNKLSSTKKLRNKPIKVSFTTNINNLEKANLIYVCKDKSANLVDFFDKIEGKNILLVSDNCQDKRVIMINFYETDKSTLQFEINKANILNQHIRIMHDMILLGGAEIDVANLYREGLQSLRSLQKHSDNLENNLKDLENIITAKTKDLEIYKDSLNKQSKKIIEQTKVLDGQEELLKQREDQIKNRDQELAKQIDKIQEQKNIFDEQSKEIDSQNIKLKKGEILLSNQNQDIKRQENEIQKQLQTLQEKGETINRQQNYLYLLLIIIILVVFLVFSIYKGYKNKKKINIELERRVEERTNELNALNAQLRTELSERKQAQESLRISEEKYRFLFERNPASLLIYEQDTLKLLAVNEAFKKNYGYLEDEALAMKLPDLYPIEEREALIDLSQNVHGHTYAGEWHHIKKGGAVISIIATSHDLDYIGQRARIAVLTDITKRKKNEDKIIKVNRVYAVISQINQTIVHVREKDKLFHEVCRIAIEFGKFQMVWIGLIDEKTQLVVPEAFDGFEDGYLSIMKTISVSDSPDGIGPTGSAIREGQHFICNDVGNDSLMYAWKDEAIKRGYRSSIALPIKLYGKIIGAFNLYSSIPNFFDKEEIDLLDEVANDISFSLEAIETERKRKMSEEELEKYRKSLEEMVKERTAKLHSANERLSAIFEAANVGIVLIRDRIIQDYNSRLEEIFGYGKNELIGKDASVWFIDENNYKSNGEPLFEQINLGGTNPNEQKLIKKDASEFWARLTGKILDPTDSEKGLVCVVEDVTAERENAESLKNAMEAAQSADRLKSAFLATMSHELRTPLNSIIGFTGILLQELPGALNLEQKKQLGMVQKSGRHLLSLINDILDLSKIEAGQLRLNIDTFMISDVVQNVIDLSKPLAVSKNINLTASVDGNMQEIVADKMRIQQVILNLVNNALKFTERGEVGVLAFQKDNSTIIKVSDSGIGIEADQIDTLFKPFIQIDSNITRTHEGTGLGLSICQKLMALSGGTIEVESEFGKGSIFTIKLPLKILQGEG